MSSSFGSNEPSRLKSTSRWLRATMAVGSSCRQPIARTSSWMWSVVTGFGRAPLSRWRAAASRLAWSIRTFLAAESEGLSHHPCDSRSLRIGGRAQRDESRIFSAALKQAASIIELTPPVKHECRVLPKGADPDDVPAFRPEPDQLPHVADRPRRLALRSDLRGARRRGLDGPARRLHDGANARRELFDLLRKRDLGSACHPMESTPCRRVPASSIPLVGRGRPL